MLSLRRIPLPSCWPLKTSSVTGKALAIAKLTSDRTVSYLVSSGFRQPPDLLQSFLVLEVAAHVYQKDVTSYRVAANHRAHANNREMVLSAQYC